MTQLNKAEIQQKLSGKTILMFSLFLLIAAAGLSYVKWWPYYHKAIHAITNHTIGSSILTGADNVAPSPSWDAAWDYAVIYFKSVWKAAVLGIVLGSLVQVLIPADWMQRVFGKNSFRSTAFGGLASVPGMMCSCCAAPVAIGMHKKRASVSASIAFWLGNPMINPAALIFMTFVLSWKFTVLRLVFGLIITFGVSYVAGRLAGNVEFEQKKLEQALPSERPSDSIWLRWINSMRKMVVHLVPAYIISVLLLGAVRVWLFPSLGENAFNVMLMILIFSIAGTLFVIPTAAEIPIVQTFLSLGFGTGPAASLLIVLPAVSLPSLLMIRRAFPARVVWFIFVSVIVLGLLSGFVGSFVL